MALISFDDVSLNYPIPGIRTHSLRSVIANKVGGFLLKSKSDLTYVSALRNISFKVCDGDRVGLIGHNGAGKTTLLRLISGAYFPTSGSIIRAATIQALTDFTLGMDDNATGRDNIVFRLTFMGVAPQEITNSIDEIIEFSGLSDFIDIPVRAYSSGMYLRLAFAISTHFMPDVLVMDEVIGVGDESFRNKATERLNSLMDTARALILSSHDLLAIQKFCNRVIVLDKGQIIYDGNVATGISCYNELVNNI